MPPVDAPQLTVTVRVVAFTSDGVRPVVADTVHAYVEVYVGVVCAYWVEEFAQTEVAEPDTAVKAGFGKGLTVMVLLVVTEQVPLLAEIRVSVATLGSVTVLHAMLTVWEVAFESDAVKPAGTDIVHE